MTKQNHQNPTNHQSKPRFRANGSALLPLALRPGLDAAPKRQAAPTLFSGRSSRPSSRGDFAAPAVVTADAPKKVWRSLALFALTLCCCFGLQSSYAGDVSASEITLSLPDKIELNISPVSGGSFSESENGSILVGTDNIGGYSLSLKAKTSSDLTNSTNPESKLPTISDNLSKDQYQNGDYNNTWAFKPDYYNNEVNTIYRPGPDAKGIVLAKATTKTTTKPEGKDKYNLAIAAKVDDSIPSGIYSNTFIMTATVNEIRYTINYNAASLEGASNAEVFTAQTGIISGDSELINSTTPTKDGATFTGWCDRALEEDGSCTGSTIQPGGKLRMCDCDTEVTLYAMWEENSNTMQNWKGCSNLTRYDQGGGIVELTDTRDGNTYKVAKLKDGNCWMVENLKIAGKTLTPEDSDVSSSFVLPSSIGGNNGESWGGDAYSTAYVHISPRWGGKYTWTAATAGTGTQSMSSGSAPSSICPKGWRLPTGGTSGEYVTLVNAYGNSYSEMYKSPVPNFQLSGTYQCGDSCSYGCYWTSMTINQYTAYNFSTFTSSLDPDNDNGKDEGSHVRCIQR